jgi:hypothetical protein
VATTDEDILKIAEQYNVGDLSLGLKPNQTRQSITNRQALKGNVFPLELVNRNKPSENFSFVWVPLGDDDFYADCKDDGYKVVTEGEWICNRPGWDWETPEKDKFRWSESRLLIHRNRFAMYRDEELYAAEMAKRTAHNERGIRDNFEKALDFGARKGVEVEATIAGKTEKAGPSRRKSVS